MGRWKDDGSGKPVWDANDTGPDQIQGMPTGGPQGGSGAPPSGGAPGGPSGGDQGAPAGGWGPIKISTHYQPDPGNPHPFDGWLNKGNQGGQQPWNNGPWSDFPGPAGRGIPGNDFPGGWNNGGAWWKQLQGQIQQANSPNPNAPTPNPGESPQDMAQRFARDYHAPDAQQVMDTMKDSNYYGTMAHTMGDPGMQPTPITPVGFPGTGWNTPPVPGLMGGNPNLGHTGLMGGVLRTLLGGGGGASLLPQNGGGMANLGVNPLIQQLLARRMNGGQ